LRKLGRYKEALASSKKAIDLNSDNPKFWFNIGRIYEVLNDTQAAERCFEKASELSFQISWP